jgi:type II secretory pathway component PulF
MHGKEHGMEMSRRALLWKAPLAIGAAGAAASAPGGRGPDEAPRAYLKDLAVMLRSGVPIERTVAALGRKYARHGALAALSLDLVCLVRRPESTREELARVFHDHRQCFSESVAERIQACIRNGNLDQVA